MADPYFNSVVLLAVNNNAANGSSTFADQSSSAKTITNVGTATYSSATAPTGMTTSGLMNSGGTKYLSVADSADWDFGTGDFTLEGFINPSSTAGAGCVMGQRTGLATEFSWLIYRSGTTLQVYLAAAANVYNIWNAGTIGTVAAGNWYHFAVTRSGNAFASYLNGVNGGTATSALGFNNSAVAVTIGANVNNGETFAGSVCSIRITKGVARYTGTGSFTPPSLPMPITAVDPPVTDFIGTPLSGEAPLLVAFSDLSTNTPTGWSWTFGDGDTSIQQNPSHTYLTAGTYTVGLTASNAGGSDLDTKNDYITVTAPVQVGDTHDYIPRRFVDVPSFEDENRKIEALRNGPLPEQIVAAIEVEEVQELVQPHTERLESGAYRLDYEAIRGDEALQARLAAIFETERKRLEDEAIEQDDEEVTLLVAH